ncbi:MAG: family 20 glycosylhydrolase, partial [Propionibacteriaceae bacterium]|nr:family 20 glycosylhydrolase [Propionibacteriaceae bacterium]
MTHPQQSRRMRFFALFASVALILGLAPALQASAADPVNLGLNRPVTASGQELSDRWGPELAFDGDPGPEGVPGPGVHNAADASRWSSPNADVAWIQVDLGNTAKITEIKTHWGNTYSNKYKLEGSADGTTWSPLTNGEVAGPASKGAWTTWTGPVDGFRHVRLTTGGGRNQPYGIGIWEIQVMGTLDGPVIEPPKPAYVDVIPRPATFVETEAGAFQLTNTTPIVATGDALSTATMLADTLRASTGLPLPVAGSGAKGITLELAPAAEIPAEGYTLVSGADGVAITASDRAGLFYGTQTLIQLLGPWARSADAVVQDWSVAALDIEDAPRFGYRGFMIDPVRSFYTVDEVKNVIDQQAAYKMNVLHMHLSDDQGWRIAITNEGKADGDDIDYSLLTSISGGTAVAPTQWTAITGRTGFYSADDFAEIVAYADARNIAIVPEIDGPAHSNAILHAIPQLNSANSFPKLKPGETTVPPNVTTSVGESSLDARNEKTYTFMKHVIADLLAKNTTTVHGTKYFHLGGDESHNTGAQDYRDYMERVAADTVALGAVPVVWNEGASQASQQLPSNTVVQHWTGGGIPATTAFLNAHADSKLIASYAPNAYIGQRPGPDVVGPSWACGQGCGINQFYNWDPSSLFDVADTKILGVVAAHWSEHTRSESSLNFQMYPRMMVTAEVGWTPQADRNLNDFRKRAASLGTSLTVTGRNFYPSD